MVSRPSSGGCCYFERSVKVSKGELSQTVETRYKNSNYPVVRPDERM